MEEGKNDNLEALKNLEKNHKGETNNYEQEKEENISENVVKEKDSERDYLGDYKLPKVIDGYRVIDNNDLAFNGLLYPKSWRFAYRCPTSMEVANFSTVNEKDQSAVINVVAELIQKCFVIVDSETNKEVSSSEINDGERLFFFLKLREFYLFDKPIQYATMNLTYQEPVTVSLFASSLVFPELNEKLLNCFNGREFSIPINGIENPIKFLIPTINLSSRIFRYMVKTYKEIQNEDTDKIKNVEAFDKQFILVAPYLYEKGNETIENLKHKFKEIQKNDKLLDAYITIINKLKLTNFEKIVYTYKESEEEALIKFPGGWKSMFIDKGALNGIFD